MLRLYKPIRHDIFKLHALLEKVVCEVWCTASDDVCDDKLDNEFKKIYKYSYKSTKKVKKTLKEEVERIYEIFKTLTPEQRESIKQAFVTNNKIETLCNGATPVYISQLPDVVANDIKPLFRWCYEKLFDNRKVLGDKMDYYNQLIKYIDNDFDTCPCCGLSDIESSDSICREDYDHYLPKSHYPFASVNFKNLVPICNKCNRDRKKAKDPIENDRIAFYPFSTEEHSIELSLEYVADIDNITKQLKFSGLKIDLIGDTRKINTWDWLFDIKTRYKDQIKTFTKTFLKRIERRHEDFLKLDENWSYANTLDSLIEDYKFDYYEEKKFLKIAFLIAIKKDVEFMKVYE